MSQSDSILTREEAARRRKQIYEQIEELEERINRLERRVTLETDVGAASTPDKRAVKLREWLLDQAEKNPQDTARMDYKTAEGVLPGLQRPQLYEAMRRAAGGDDLAENGSSELSPAPGIEWQEKQGRNNRVVLNLDVLQEMGGCKNITTRFTPEGDK